MPDCIGDLLLAPDLDRPPPPLTSAHAQAPTTGMPGYQLQQAGNLMGGGDDMAIIYSSTGAGGGGTRMQVPRLARAQNTTTGGISVEYLEPERALPGREAWLVGGGDLEVVYFDPASSLRR